MNDLDPTVARITDRIIAKSKDGRRRYLDLIAREADNRPERSQVSCSNLAHAFAGAEEDQEALKLHRGPNIGVVTSYNDMLSAHAPYYRYPERLKIYAREIGATVQVAGGTPAMCDGVTQGETGMELSLFSRDAIAMATGIALSHAMYDGMLLLGICDKIVPGLLIGALRFGHLPAVFVPSGPMPSGVSNKAKQAVRQFYAEGKATRAELLDSELGSYHSPGTCTFYGTANSNQMMMELMGLHVPGAAFVQPGTKLRQALDRAAVHRVAAIGQDGDDYRPIGQCVDEKAVVNAMVGLLATGGSTNHAIHIPAMARAAGIQVDWTDLSELSHAVPLIARVYPNGSGDVNHFHEAGGMGYVIGELLGAGLAHADVMGVAQDRGMTDYAREPGLDGDALAWREVGKSGDAEMLRPATDPFQADGGMRLLEGNLGRACFKSSAVDKARWTVEAPCRVFQTQHDVAVAFASGELDRDVVVVVRFQGPRANGMPELHKLTPPLGVLQDRGYRVALVTDGRMSGASGKVPAAIHVSPEAYAGAGGRSGPLSLLRDGDMVRVCAETGTLSTSADLSQRTPAPDPAAAVGTGRELFAMFRHLADEAEKGGSAMLASAGL
ncbi:phosphogluconate dehydratase [Erythrobacter arachoides]|uniref:Phosphogluconate dehydratase n=1 Tax=Aurantiacibacter arachoides TaxID=1850444 RepID=A0A844ZW72_9SPHN|nr:phosphogluconate dehydratase [Aurantiacibacter arachoides]MXO92333.1 phosphogluconate dehydratase [Aurantiacibacter arachoides]GGD58021.1 phosphogluconate dehydratase [Aurantiacibacter arachoides]